MKFLDHVVKKIHTIVIFSRWNYNVAITMRNVCFVVKFLISSKPYPLFNFYKLRKFKLS